MNIYHAGILGVLIYIFLKVTKKKFEKKNPNYRKQVEINFWEHAIVFLFSWFSYSAISVILHMNYYPR